MKKLLAIGAVIVAISKNLIGKEFVHFKGGYYRLVGYTKDSETLKRRRRCIRINSEPRDFLKNLWARPTSRWLASMTLGPKSRKNAT